MSIYMYRTHTTHKAKPSAVVLAWSHLPSEPTLAHLCAAGARSKHRKILLGSTSNPQEAVQCPTSEGVGT